MAQSGPVATTPDSRNVKEEYFTRDDPVDGGGVSSGDWDGWASSGLARSTRLRSDTESVCWLLLSRKPEAMTRILAEHDTVLGTVPDQAASLLIENPGILNQLTYTFVNQGDSSCLPCCFVALKRNSTIRFDRLASTAFPYGALLSR